MAQNEFSGVTAVAKANVYFDGKVVSHSIVFPDQSRKTLGLIYPGCFHFGTNAAQSHEFKGLRTSVQFDCKTSPLKVVDGSIRVPTGPGLGVDLDPAYVSKHQPVRA